MESGASARAAKGALRQRANWIQFLKFSLIGGFGYLVNLAVFAFFVTAFKSPDDLAAVIAFCVAVVNNFVWNRYWTFGAVEGKVMFQAVRFLTVSVACLALNLVVLELLVRVYGLGDIPAQAIAVAAATPASFLGNKLWTFA